MPGDVSDSIEVKKRGVNIFETVKRKIYIEII